MMSYVILTAVYPKHTLFYEACESEGKNPQNIESIQLDEFAFFFFLTSLGVKDI